MTGLEKQSEKIFDTAADVRKFEINLFWQRSLFFWGLVAAAFVGYASLVKERPNIAFLIACFGVVCSVAWSLANRGSKYWQEYWELEVEKTEVPVLGRQLFVGGSARKTSELWLAPRQYSVSKITIALSDFATFIWACLAIRRLDIGALSLPFKTPTPEIMVWLIFGGTSVFIILMLVCCRSGPRPKN